MWAHPVLETHSQHCPTLYLPPEPTHIENMEISITNSQNWWGRLSLAETAADTGYSKSSVAAVGELSLGGL